MSCDHVQFLDDAARSLSWLAREIGPSFGPLGKDVALFHEGHLLVTADGATILDTLVDKRRAREGRAEERQEHDHDNPVVAFALQRASALVRGAGDGSIALVLFLSCAVQRMQSATRSAGMRGRGFESRELRALALQLARVRQTALPRRIIPRLHELAVAFTCKILVEELGMSRRDVLLQLLRSHLAGTFPPHVCAALALMAVEWIGVESGDGATPEQDATFLDKVYHGARAVEAKLPHCVVQVPGATLLSSTVLRGHYLLRRPVFGKRGRERLVVKSPCHFCVALGHSVLSAGDGDGSDGGLALPISLMTTGSEDVALAAACRRGHQRRALEGLARAGVNVLLYEEALDRGAAHEIERVGIVAVDLVEREELLHLAELAGIVPIGRSDVAELGFGGGDARAAAGRAVGRAGRARPLTLGGEPFFIFERVERRVEEAEMEAKASCAPAASQLLLRAASASLCSHYYRSMRRCLRIAARWAQPVIGGCDCRGLVLPGAAVTELCVSAWLHRCATVRRGEEEVRGVGDRMIGGGGEKTKLSRDLQTTRTSIDSPHLSRLGSRCCRPLPRPFPRPYSATLREWEHWPRLGSGSTRCRRAGRA